MSPKFKILILLFILFWFIGIFFLPLFQFLEKTVFIFPFLKDLYGNVCHQEIAKTLEVNNYPLLVCARCSGIYFGAFIFSIIFLVIAEKFYQHKLLLPTIIVIVIIDVSLSTLGLINYSKISAFTTGFLLGSVSFIYFYNALIELISKKRKSN